MTDIKMCYGIPPKPLGTPTQLISVEEAHALNPSWKPGWNLKETGDGFVHERFGERRLVALQDRETLELRGDKILRLEPQGAVSLAYGIDASGVLRIALQWQYRDAVRKPSAPPWTYKEAHDPSNFGCWSLEIPRGFGKEKIAAAKTALQEVAEEIGYGEPICAQPLGLLCPNTTFDTPQPVFAVQFNIVPPDPSLIQLDKEEAVSGIVGWMTLREINRAIVEKKIFCAFTKASVAEICAMIDTGTLNIQKA